MDGGYRAKDGAAHATNVGSQASRSGGGQSVVTGEDFPQICETCLGNNPYVRMTKTQFGSKLCKVSNVPFQGFRWKAGTNGRFKETMVCIQVAQHRNICQACLNDMQYGLPVGVRDKLLREGQLNNNMMIPTSQVGQEYYYQEQAASGQTIDGNVTISNANISAAERLKDFSKNLLNSNAVVSVAQGQPPPPPPPGPPPLANMSQLTPAAQAAIKQAEKSTAFRNLPRLCSFWLGGTCTRVSKKLCPFRPCCGSYAFPEIAGSHKDLCTELVKRLGEEGPLKVMQTLSEETRTAIKERISGYNRDDAIRKRVQGDDDLSKAYLSKLAPSGTSLQAPSDTTITTLWVGGVETDINEQDLISVFYPFGQIVNCRISRGGAQAKGCAFVQFSTRFEAETAAAQLHNALYVRGKSLALNWAKPRDKDNSISNTGPPEVLYTNPNTGFTVSSKDANAIPAPPGMENVPISAYALPGMPLPAAAAPPPPPTSKRSREGENDLKNLESKKHASAGDTYEGVGSKSTALSGLANYDDDSD